MAETSGASDSAFEKKVSEQTAASAFQLAWGVIKNLGLKGWEEKRVRTAMKKYAANYRDRHGEVKVLGMSQPVPLHQIYTAVRVVRPDYLHAFVRPAEMEKSFRDSDRRHRYFGYEKSRNAIEVANEIPFLNVLGAPGAGKSTFLRRLGQEAMLAQGLSEKGGRDKRLASRFEHPKLPVLLELRRFRDDSGKVDLIAALVEEFAVCEFPESRDFVVGALKNGGLLVILDGLDEVPEKRLDETIRAVRDLVTRFSDNRFITSCRTAHYKNYFKQFTDVVLADFNDGQIGQFAQNWFASAEDIREKTHERFLKQLEGKENSSAKELARTPLLLTFLCLTFDRDQMLPPTRALLYRRALDILLREWAAEKRVHNEAIFQELHADLELDMLAEMAARFFQKNRYFFSREEALSGIRDFMERQLRQPPTLDADRILEAIEKQQGLIVRRAADAYSFSHLTIQEYLTAQEFSQGERWRSLVENSLFDEGFGISDRCREVFLLLAGMGEADALLIAMAEIIRIAPAKTTTMRDIVDWVSTVTLSDRNAKSEYRFVARLTLLALGLSLAIGRALDLDLDLDLIRALVRILEVDRNVSDTLALDFDRPLNLDRRFDHEFNHQLVHIPAPRPFLERTRARTRARVRAGDLTHNLIDSIVRHRLFHEDLRGAFVAAKSLRKDDDPVTVFANVCETLAFLDLTAAHIEDLVSISPLLEACKLVVDCRDAAYRMTAEGWDQVCDMLLTIYEEAPAKLPESQA